MKRSVTRVLQGIADAGFDDPLDAPDELVRKLCEEPCFNIKEVGRRLRLNNRGTQVLNAHLALDHVVTTFLNDEFIPGASIKLDRMPFDQKVELLYSLGFLREENRRWAKRINTIRNKLAHELSFKIPDKDVIELTTHFKDADENGLMKRRPFAHALLIVVVAVDNDRIRKILYDVKQHLALLNIRKVLKETAPD